MWTKLDGLFGTVNEFKAFQIEVELISLIHDYFPSIKEFLMKFKKLRSLLQGCGKIKIDTKCIYLILSKLHGNFQIFSSTFYSIKDALVNLFTMPSFEVFCDRLT